MSSRSKEQQHKRPIPSKVFCGLALSLVLLPILCPLSQALEAAPSGQPAPQAGQNATLDAQLDKYQNAIDGKTLSMADFERLAALAGQNPTNARVHLLFGRGFDMQGLSDQAVDQYQIADKYGPTDPEAIAAILHNVLAKGGGDAANTLLNSAIKRFPNNPEILFMIGKRLKEDRHWAEAGKIFVKVYGSGAKVPGLPSELGDLIVSEDPMKAIALAKEDLALKPDSAPALLLLSKGEMLVGNFQLALGPLEKLYQQAPTNSDSTEMYLRCLYWAGDYRKAIEASFYCLRNDAHYVVPVLRSATTLSHVLTHLPASYASSALQNFYEKTDKAKTPVEPPFHFFVGRVFFRLHRYPEAKAELLRFLDSDPNSAETLWMLGNIAETQDHDYVTALKYYRLAHALLPYHPVIAGACLSLEERMADLHNDWAWCLRDWLYSTFSWGQH